MPGSFRRSDKIRSLDEVRSRTEFLRKPSKVPASRQKSSSVVFGQIIQMLHNLVGAGMITKERRFPDKTAEHGFPASVSPAGFFLSDGIIAFDQTVDHHCKAKFLSLPGGRNIFPAADGKIVVDRQPVVLQIINRRRGIFLRHQGIIAEQNTPVFRAQFAVIQKFAEEIIVGGCLFRFRNIELQQSLQGNSRQFTPVVLVFPPAI